MKLTVYKKSSDQISRFGNHSVNSFLVNLSHEDCNIFSVPFHWRALTSFASFHTIFINICLQVVKKLNAHYFFLPFFLLPPRGFGLFIIWTFVFLISTTTFGPSFTASLSLHISLIFFLYFLASKHCWWRRPLRWQSCRHRQRQRLRRQQQHQRLINLRHFCLWLTDWPSSTNHLEIHVSPESFL